MVEKEDRADMLKDMDLFLKENLVRLWFEAINYSVNNDWKKTFIAYKSMFHMIEPYNFVSKPAVTEMVSTINEYLRELENTNKTINLRAELKYRERKIIFRELMDELMSLLPRAFVDLGLWFKNIEIGTDIDLKLSQENFGDDLTLVEKKILALKKLSIDQLLNIMNNNNIHDTYARGLSENVL